MQKTVRHWWKKSKITQTNTLCSWTGRSNIVKMTIWPQSNIQIQCNLYQITSGIFYRTRTKKFIICMETQKIPNSQSNLGKEKWNWKNQTPWLQTILQSYSHQNSMVLAQKQIHWLMEHDRKPRNKPRHLWSITLWQRRQEYTMEKT